MKLKFLLFLFLISTGILQAQDTIRSLIISEARITNGQINCYLELTNVSNENIDLSQFELGSIPPWNGHYVNDVYNDPFAADPGRSFMLPSVILEPGESWVVTTAYDFGPEQYNKRITGFENTERPKNPGIYEYADALIHIPEPKGDETDSVTVNWKTFSEQWGGNGSYYIEQHLSETDSITIDQVGGVFDNDGRNFSQAYDVAGVSGATGNSIIVRKYSVKAGNVDFANARGVGLDDSEWMPIPEFKSHWRDVYWTVGNHGDYNLDENTLISEEVEVDLTNKTLTVPWGTRRGDGIMHKMEKKPGIAWDYHLSPEYEDSLTFACRTGDQITIYVCGNDLDMATFSIIVKDPSPDANFVVPVTNKDVGGYWRENVQNGILDWPRITEHTTGMDTISGTWFGIPYATRTDSLLERLEKASNASWEFVWVDAIERPDLKNGDKLKITAENGDIKEYFIQVRPYEPNHDAFLSAITWPDIPEFYKGIFGWLGDTIPNFNRTTYNYRVQVPYDVDGIPALMPKTRDLNSTVDVSRATSLTGSDAQRTTKFIVTAEDDSVTQTYNVELIKEKPIDKIQPNYAEPFLSEYVFWEQWNNSYCEIANPGNQPLDLSDYMIVMTGNNNQADAITLLDEPTDWLDRYDKYVPGYKWVDEETWSVSPAMLEKDLSVNPIVQPGDVFCMGYVVSDGTAIVSWAPDYVWPVPEQLDVQFNNYEGAVKSWTNPWGEESGSGTYNGTPVGKWATNNWYMYKILNDSVKLGLKPATDPNDFELIETWGMGDNSMWNVTGSEVTMSSNYIRKPEFHKGKPGFQESFGSNPDDSEWLEYNREYWQQRNAGWPWEALNIVNDLGQHYMYAPTEYISTVTSVVYKVSNGYSLSEDIQGLRTSTTVANLLSNVVKADEGQTLKVVSNEDGTVLAMDDLLNMNDTLVVLSADSTNITKYRLDVTEEGLSSNAVLSSTKYTIEIKQQPSSLVEEDNISVSGLGTIRGFEYGTQLKTILANIVIPAGASLTTIDESGAYVPLVMLNYDTSYVDVTVNSETYFEVVAEDGTTTILYQLLPQASESSAFLTSNVYSVEQGNLLIKYVPRGTTVDKFLKNVYPSTGASVKVVDKYGLERTDGEIVQDDRIPVTSEDDSKQTVYYLSMLRTRYLKTTTYLAYVTSNVYEVDQINMNIMGSLTGDTDLSTFYSRIIPASGATAVVIDVNGEEKTSGDLDQGDMLKVISADGEVEVMYSIEFSTFAITDETLQFNLYPNPTDSKVNISGLQAGERIQVFSSMGKLINNFNAQRNIETISLQDRSSGIYFIVIRDGNDDRVLGHYKVIKK